MKLVKAVLLVSLLVFGSAKAEGVYSSLTYDKKERQNSTQIDHVYGLNVGEKFSNGVGFEVRLEDERIEPGAGAVQKQEGLAQAKLSYDISTGTSFTPYVAGAYGHKNKSASDFNFWLAEVGVKAKFGDFGAQYGVRRRAAFDTSNAYDTTEQTLTLGYSVTKHDNVSFAYKQESRNNSVSSEYNTKGIYYTRSF